MMNKSSNFFEEHIEKMILAVAVILFLGLLIKFVVISPNNIEYDNKSFTPGEIDNYILNKQATLLDERLNREPEAVENYVPQLNMFLARYNLPITGIDSNMFLPIPAYSNVRGIEPKYGVPAISELYEPLAEHIRAVAYVPTEELGKDKTYDNSTHEPQDIDLVTVEAKIDIAALYASFHDNYAGDTVKQEWRDPCLAQPVFAAVELQRQELLGDGQWSEWQNVPRSHIDSRSKMFESVVKSTQLPTGGIKARIMQFDDIGVMTDLLQPQPYQIASAEEEWFPPSLHGKYVELVRKEESKEKREAREAKAKEQEQEREEKRNKPKTTPLMPSSGKATGGADLMLMGPGMGGALSPARKPAMTSKPKPVRPERINKRQNTAEKDNLNKLEVQPKVSKDIYTDFQNISINSNMDFKNMEDLLVMWAYDDTVQPGKTYQYRIRLGVFNPVAGTNEFVEDANEYKDKAVLWSEYASIDNPVEIPAKLYFFPLRAQTVAKTVQVTVTSYVLGYWYSNDFIVKQGENIGRVTDFIPPQVKNKNDDKTKLEAVVKPEVTITYPKTVDYATGTVLVDIVDVNDWSGKRSMTKRYYSDMLYSNDGSEIKHISVESKDWPKSQQERYTEIMAEVKKEKKPLREWGQKPSQRSKGPVFKPGTRGMPGMDQFLGPMF